MLVITPPLQQSKNNLPQPSSLLLHVTYSPLVFFELSQKFILLFFLPLVHLESVKSLPTLVLYLFFLSQFLGIYCSNNAAICGLGDGHKEVDLPATGGI
jgi:hypothetical protein